MKLYEFEGFPNPRRVRIFLAEKGISVERVKVNVPAGDHRKPAYTSLNPFAEVPALELDDGTVIAESAAICSYFEAVHPNPPLLGRTPTEKAVIDMWQRRIELGVFNRVSAYFHHATPGLGALEDYQNKAWGERSRDDAVATLVKIDGALEGRDFIAGDFSIADITGLVALDTAAFLKIEVPNTLANVKAWHARLAERASAKA